LTLRFVQSTKDKHTLPATLNCFLTWKVSL